MKCYDLTPTEHKAANKSNPVVTTRDELLAALRQLGIREGQRLVVHSAFSSLGVFEGGPEALCRTLMEFITPAGILMMPALSKYPADGEVCVYDPETSPVRVGIVPDTFRKMPGVARSWDPTHSFCAWGQDNVRFLAGHHLVPTMDAQSPLGLLEQADGYALMIGCYRNVTFMHVVETSVGGGCTGERTELYDARIHGEMVKLRGWGWRDGECLGRNNELLFDHLREHGLMTEMMLHRCHLVCFRLADYRKALELQLKNPETGCAVCAVKPRQVDRTVLSDWDAKRRCIIGSDAFTGNYQRIDARQTQEPEGVRTAAKSI